MLLYSPQADELRAALRDVFGWEHVEDTPGWAHLQAAAVRAWRPPLRRRQARAEPHLRRHRGDGERMAGEGDRVPRRAARAELRLRDDDGVTRRRRSLA